MDDGRQLSKKTNRILPPPGTNSFSKSGRLVKGSPEAFARMEQLRLIREEKKKQKEANS